MDIVNFRFLIVSRLGVGLWTLDQEMAVKSHRPPTIYPTAHSTTHTIYPTAHLITQTAHFLNWTGDGTGTTTLY